MCNTVMDRCSLIPWECHTRSELVFATEAVIATLTMCIPGSPLASHNSEALDEIEVRYRTYLSNLCQP